jgi:hypothetical protein
VTEKDDQYQAWEDKVFARSHRGQPLTVTQTCEYEGMPKSTRLCTVCDKPLGAICAVSPQGGSYCSADCAEKVEHALPGGEGQLIKMVLGKGETGWATDLGQGLARIRNIALDRVLRYGDIVEYETVEGRRHVKRVIHREYPEVATLRYDKTGDFYRLKLILQALGAVVEGGITPEPERLIRGFVMVAYDGVINPYLIAEGLGIPEPHRSHVKEVREQMRADQKESLAQLRAAVAAEKAEIEAEEDRLEERGKLRGLPFTSWVGKSQGEE